MTPSQYYKSSHKGFSLAELTAAAVIMVGIWLGALAYMNAASEEFDEAKEETLAQAPEEDIAILTEIRAAESALVAAEAVTEEARRAAEAARERAAARELEAARRAAEAAREQAYRQLLRELIEIIDSGGDVTSRLTQHKDVRASRYKRGGRRFDPYKLDQNYIILLEKGRFPAERSVLDGFCGEAVRSRGWRCESFPGSFLFGRIYTGGNLGWGIRVIRP